MDFSRNKVRTKQQKISSICYITKGAKKPELMHVHAHTHCTREENPQVEDLLAVKTVISHRIF